MRIVVASDSAFVRQQLRIAVLAQGLSCAATTGAQLPFNVQDAQLILLAVGLDLNAALTAIHGCGNAPVHIVCDESNLSDVPNLLRAGAKGYLRYEQLSNDLEMTLNEVREAEDVPVKWGRVIAVTASLSGVGTTTIATNLAFALAANHPGHVALMQVSDNDLALNLDLRPTSALADLTAGWCRLDAAILSRRMIDHPAGISVLADQKNQFADNVWPPAALRQVLTLLRSRFDYVIVDVGHERNEAQLATLRFADDVLVVLRLDAPSLERTSDLLETLDTDRIVGVINRYGQEQQLDWHQVQRELDIEVVEWVPDDPASVNQSLNARKPLLQIRAKTPIVQSFARLASRWTKSDVKQPEQNWLEVG